jgi:type VI secretion system protein ImpJ
MTRAADIPEAIHWQDGMLLAPQHFQQLVLRAEALVHYHAAAIQPYHWGVRRTVAFDQMLLSNGTLRVTELEAVMPDGLVVHHVPGPGDELQLDLTPFAEAARGNPVTVHLAVAARRASRAPSDAELARYDLAEVEAIADENAHDSEVSIARLKPRLLLMAVRAGEPKPPGKYVSFPIARVVYRDEVFVPADFAPPMLGVELRSPIGKLCAELARRLREKAVFLADQVGGAVTPQTLAATQEMRATLRCIVSGLPGLEALLNSERAHPFALYLALMQVTGEMAAIGGGVVPPQFDPYDHDDPRASFAGPLQFLQKSLDRVEEAYQPVPFTAERDRFSLVMEQAWLQPKLVIGVRGATGAPEAATVAWVEEALIGVGSGLMQLFEARVRGAERRRIAADGEYELLPRRGVLLYEVTLEPSSLAAGAALEIWNPATAESGARPAEILLYVRMRP